MLPRNPGLARTLATLLLALPLAVAAHVAADGGAHHGFMAGSTHPFTGLDHLLAMVAVGLWSARTAPVADWRRYAIAPIAFAALLLVGALLARNGVTLPAVEPMIAASIVVLGLLIAWQRALPVAAGAALVGGFALFHGAAHGQELAGSGALIGMVLATVLLHVAGLVAGHWLRQGNQWLGRSVGAVLAVVGGSLLFV